MSIKLYNLSVIESDLIHRTGLKHFSPVGNVARPTSVTLSRISQP